MGPNSEPRFFGPDALAASARCLRDLLAEFYRRLHVVTATLQLPKSALTSHLPLEVLDRTLDAFVSNLDLKGPALHCFSRISHGPRDMADGSLDRKPISVYFRLDLS